MLAQILDFAHPHRDTWKSRIFRSRALLEIDDRSDASLLKKLRQFLIVRSNVANTMAIIRQREITSHSKELLYLCQLCALAAVTIADTP